MTISTISQNKLISNKYLNWVWFLVFITAPYFYLGQDGADFINSDRLSLVDLFLCLTLISTAIFFRKKKIFINRPIKILIFLATIFVFWAIVSTLIGSFFYDSLHSFNLFIGLSQYAFVMIGLPFLAASFLPNKTNFAIKLICLCYLPPMIINLLLTPDSAPTILRQLFFYTGRALGTYGNANSFSLVLVIVLPLYIYLTTLDQIKWKFLGYIGQILSLFCLIETMSFSAFIVLFILILLNFFIFIFYQIRDKRSSAADQLNTKNNRITVHIFKYFLLPSLATVYLLYSLLFYFAPHELLLMNHRLYLPVKKVKLAEEINLKVFKFGSLLQRMELMKKATLLIKQRNGSVFFGHGLNNTSNFESSPVVVHNVFLLLWLEGGLILMLIYLSYFLYLCSYILKSYRQNPALVIAIFSSVSGFILYSMLSSHIYLRCFWVPLFAAFSFIARDQVIKSDIIESNPGAIVLRIYA